MKDDDDDASKANQHSAIAHARGDGGPGAPRPKRIKCAHTLNMYRQHSLFADDTQHSHKMPASCGSGKSLCVCVSLSLSLFDLSIAQLNSLTHSLIQAAWGT